MKLTGGQIVAKFLENAGIRYVAGIPGHGALPLTDALYRSQKKLSPIQPRQEMCGVHMADGYFRTTGKPMAVFTSIGPGAINTAIGVATCFVDSTPVMVFTGDTHTYMFGKGVLQEIERRQDSDFAAVMKPVAKRTWLVTNLKQLPSVLRRAWATMMAGRKGPVVISLPMDIQAASMEVDPKTLVPGPIALPPQPDPRSMAAALKLMKTARRPMILAGGGVLYGDACGELLALAETWGAPTMTTLAGKGAFPETHPLSAWLGGSKGTGIGNAMAPKADVLLAVGARFADETASSYRHGATYAVGPTQVIHVDIDPAEIGKNYPVAVGLQGTAKDTLAALCDGLAQAGYDRTYAKGDYFRELKQVKKQWFKKMGKVQSKRTTPVTVSRLLKELREALPDDAIVAYSSGHTQAQILQEFPFSVPGTSLTTAGFSTMGWALPAAMGAKLGNPDRVVVSVTGDGDFMMTMQELSCALQYGINVVHVVANNGGWISIRDLQMEAFGEERGYMTEFNDAAGNPVTPNFSKVAAAFGCWSKRVSRPGEVAKAVRLALRQDRPALVEVMTTRKFPISGGEATGWWDVPVPTYLKARRSQYEKGRKEEKL